MSTEVSKKNRQTILIEDSIYTEYDLKEIEEKQFAQFLMAEGALDAYCVECEKNSVFHVKGESYISEDKIKNIPKSGVVNISARCTRDGNVLFFERNCPGRLEFPFQIKNEKLIKIGQYPSKADLDFNSLDPVFSKELTSEFREELGRAIGLRAHGIGVGSFVYLRRIFESLVEEAHISAKKRDGWDEELYKNSSMPQKITLLKKKLPNKLVKTSELYGILSKGLHELDEDNCLSHFDLIVEAIKIILKEKHEEKEYRKIVTNVNKAARNLKK